MGNYSSISIEELIQRCSTERAPEAWEEFVRRFHRLIAIVVLRTAGRLGDSSKQTVDDLVQETYLKLCADSFRILRSFQQQHPEAFAGYIKVLAVNVVRDHFKASYTQKRGSGHVQQMGDDVTPAIGERSIGSSSSMEREVLLREIALHLDKCLSGPERGRNRQIFWLYYRVGLSARSIAQLPGIGLTAKGVESIIARITNQLRESMTAPSNRDESPARHRPKGFLPA